METPIMRKWVKAAYPGEGWKKKVEKMPDDQIVALFHQLRKRGKIRV